MPAKSDETKAMFVRAFEEQLTVQPLDKITVTALTRKCGVNRQTFYYHFVDIHHFLQFAFRSLLEEVFKASSTEHTLQDGLKAAFGVLDEKKHVVLALTESIEYAWIRRDLLQCISDYCARRYARRFAQSTLTDQNIGFLTRMYTLVAFEFVERWYTERSFSDMDSFAENFDIFITPFVMGTGLPSFLR